jgi:hypothetical protein
MGVMLQAFYWDCPKAENREHEWWTLIKSRLPGIAEAGFTALWLPPANKAAGWKSMGYDPYDYYDLGEFDQKGGVPTWFGPKAELLDLIQSAHVLGLQVYADLVFNHNSGGDAQELNPIDGSMKQMRGRTIRSVRLISRCAGACVTCATATDLASAISQNAESWCGTAPPKLSPSLRTTMWCVTVQSLMTSCSLTPSSLHTKVIRASSGRITSTGISPSPIIKAVSTRSSRFTSKMQEARPRCFW